MVKLVAGLETDEYSEQLNSKLKFPEIIHESHHC